jgi:adenosylcobinamide-GDP ribazoletransferase
MRSAIAFLTPFGRATVPTARTAAWFPVVGLAIGLAIGGIWWGAARLLPVAVAAAVVVAADALCTGSLHLDGLTDAADGLLPPMPRARRLEVMRDPAVGAFGAVTLAVVLLLRFSVFASVRPAPLVLAALWGTSRSGMVVASRTSPYVRGVGGLATAFGVEPSGSGPRSRRWLVPVGAGVVLCVASAAVGRHLRGVVALGCAAVAYALVIAFSRRRIGGFTGDVLGAAGVVAETVGLVALAVR